MQLAHRLHRKFFFFRTGRGACPGGIRGAPGGLHWKNSRTSYYLARRTPSGGRIMATGPAETSPAETGRDRWQRRFDQATAANRAGRDADFTTLSGLEVDPVYGPPDGAVVPGLERIGWPGEFPFTRGIHPTGYRGKPWTIRQFSGFGNARQTNERYKMLLAAGGAGLSVAFDMPTLIGDLMQYCGRRIPRYKPLSVSGYHIREAGSTAAQELAFTLADGFGYVELGLSRGLDVDEFAPGLSFFFDAHIDFFEEIAKFRAARRIWARWLRDVYGARSERAQRLRFHTQTAGVSLTAQQPDNNIVRTAVEALAAVLGGTNSLHTNALDEVLALPGEAAAETALRTQQVIMEETGVMNVSDPLGGSWYVEALTDRMEAEAEAIFARIREMSADGSMTDGILQGIENGWFTGEIAEASFAYQQKLEKGEKKIVGVNCYPETNGQPLEILRVSRQVEQDQVTDVARRRAARDQAAVGAALAGMIAAARSGANMVPPMVDAALAEATLGEICGTLREEWGEYSEAPAF